MRALRLDYKDKRRRPGRADAVLLAVSLVIATASGAAAITLFPRITTLEAQQAHRHRAIAVADTGSRLTAEDALQLRAELKSASNVVGLLSLPWDALFADIEASQNDQVALLAVEPDPDKRMLIITAEAKDFDAMLSYLRRLQTRTSIKNVYLKSHQIDLKRAEAPIRFSLMASWVVQP